MLIPFLFFWLVFNLSPVLGECFAEFSLAASTSLGCRTAVFLLQFLLGVVSVLQHTPDGQMETLSCLKSIFFLYSWPRQPSLRGGGAAGITDCTSFKSV